MAGGPAPESDGPAPVRLSENRPSAREEASAARLYLMARDSLDAGAFASAAAAATGVVQDHPGSAVSADALWVRARAYERMGDRTLQALDDADRLLAALPGDDARVPAATLLRARLLAGLGEPAEALRAALSVQRQIPPSEDLSAWVRERMAEVGPDDAADLAAMVDATSPLASVVWVEAGRRLRAAGRTEEAADLGGRAIRAGATGDDLEVARALSQNRPLPGEVPERVTLAAILPKSGSPSMRRIADRIEQGIQAAIEATGRSETIELQVLDDGGDPMAASALVQAAERSGAVAILGPLGTEALVAGADARRSDIPMVSPTAFEVPGGRRDVLSLSAFDPTGVEALAEWAAAGPVGSVAVLHPAYGPSAEEARRFAEAYRSRGGDVSGMISYEPGQTYFEEQILAALATRPQALLLPIPPEDVVALAPQVTFFGLDTLGIRILGTGGWTDAAVLQEVSTRHLNGVIAASPVRPIDASEGRRRFLDAYEARFRRTLVDGAVEELGYDAAALVLQAVESGAGRADAVVPMLERQDAFRGATGDLTVRDGLVRRSYSIVCLDRGSLLPTPAGQLPVLQYRPYPPDPETDSIPEGPGRMAGYLCPQVAPPPAGMR